LVQEGEFGEAFDTTLFALQTGEYSQPIVTEFGVHLIYLHSIQKQQPPTFAQRRKQLENQLLAEQSEGLFVAASETLADISFSSPDLTDAADELGLAIKTTDWTGRSGGSGIGAETQVINAAFSDDVLVQGNNSQLIELSSDRVVVVRVLKHSPSVRQELADVEALITTKLMQQSALQALQQQTVTLLESLQQGKNIEAVAQQVGGKWQFQLGASRRSEEVSPQLVEAVFALPRPDQDLVYGMTPILNGDMALLQLKAVNEPAADSFSTSEKASFAELLSRINGQTDQAGLKRAITDNAEIIRH
jgi:peptidyl-prolyl cis-trans isomerase D